MHGRLFPAHYAAVALHKLLFGHEYRHTSTTAVRIPANKLEIFRVTPRKLIANFMERMRLPVCPKTCMIIGQQYFYTYNKIKILPPFVIRRPICDVGFRGSKCTFSYIFFYSISPATFHPNFRIKTYAWHIYYYFFSLCLTEMLPQIHVFVEAFGKSAFYTKFAILIALFFFFLRYLLLSL